MPNERPRTWNQTQRRALVAEQGDTLQPPRRLLAGHSFTFCADCEWCLGNAAWHSRNKRPGQHLIVRFHRMEDTPYSGRVDLGQADSAGRSLPPHAKLRSWDELWHQWEQILLGERLPAVPTRTA